MMQFNINWKGEKCITPKILKSTNTLDALLLNLQLHQLPWPFSSATAPNTHIRTEGIFNNNNDV